jgi:hypothetical protein
MLRAMGIEDEKIDQIIEAHSETVDGLKAERDKYKDAKGKADALAVKVEELQKELETSKGDGGWAEKYAALEKEYTDFKAKIEGEKVHANKAGLYRALLETAGIDPKRIDRIMKVSDVDSLEIGEDGKLADSEKLAESVKDEWSDFVLKTETKGANVDTPPTAGTGQKSFTMDEIRNMSTAEINANWDAVKNALNGQE